MPLSGSLSEFVPRGYQRSADRERLFLEEFWKDYDDATANAIDFLCTQRYRNRPDIGYVSARSYLSVVHYRKEGRKPARTTTAFKNPQGYARFRELVENPQVQMILIPIGCYNAHEPIGHRLLVVVDKTAKRVEFYDSNGADAHVSMFGDVVIRAVMKFFKGDPMFGGGGLRAYKPLTWDQTCSRFGLQFFEAIAPKALTELGGFCVIWSIFLMDLRIRYPQHNPLQVQAEYIERIMRRAIPNLQIRNDEVEALVMWMMKKNPDDSVLRKYFSSIEEAQKAAVQISTMFREFIKNYLSYLTKVSAKTRTKTKVDAPQSRKSRSRNPFWYIDM